VPRLPVIILSPAVEGRPYEAGHVGRRPEAFPTRAPQRAQVTVVFPAFFLPGASVKNRGVVL
jgi:hypothetical protein